MPKEKYSLGEAAAVFGFTGIIGVVVIFLIGVPIGLLSAWIRSTIWNWFAVPYLHLPHIGVWLMFVIGLFAAMFMPTFPSLKKEVKENDTWKETIYLWAGDFLSFFLAWIIHIWILKG